MQKGYCLYSKLFNLFPLVGYFRHVALVGASLKLLPTWNEVESFILHPLTFNLYTEFLMSLGRFTH
jgi:hypothetical protein